MSVPNPEFQPPPEPTAPPDPPKLRPKNMLVVGIVLFVLGLGICGAGVAKIMPGGIGTGAFVAFFGILLFALSFVSLPQVAPDAPAPLGALERITGIFYEPTNVFKNLRAHPRWVAGVLVMAILNVTYVAAFTQRLTPDRIVNFTVDKMAETPFIPPEAVERARDEGLRDAKLPAARVGNAIKGLVGAFFAMFFVGALFLVALLAFGGKINYWQSVSVVTFASLPAAVITKVVSFILLYIKSLDDIHPLMGQETLLQDNLGVLFAPKDHPVLFVLASAIGVLSFYRLWLTAKGLHEGGQKVSSSAAWGVTITLWALLLLFGVAIASLFPAFIS